MSRPSIGRRSISAFTRNMLRAPLPTVAQPLRQPPDVRSTRPESVRHLCRRAQPEPQHSRLGLQRLPSWKLGAKAEAPHWSCIVGAVYSSGV